MPKKQASPVANLYFYQPNSFTTFVACKEPEGLARNDCFTKN